MLQEVIVAILFAGVLVYWGIRIWRKKSAKNQNGCGCEKCG
ncbi:FeoB-associated Cys-rich membrane protein [Cyclobacterium salsum]|nr:FeoB-associated Cys-rich membrane protein [Cyclobacterium salsum]